MRFYRRLRSLSALALLACSVFSERPSLAQNRGFTINRYDPTPAGEWSFWVDHPWYSRTRYFAAGVTLNYAHKPLVLGVSNGTTSSERAVIEHQLLGHIDIAGSFLDRVTLNASLPLTFLERGTAAAGVTPTEGFGVGDPRLGAMVRLFGQPDESAVSLSLGANVYIPLRALTGDSSVITPTSSDTGFRILPKLVLAGYGSHIRWSALAGFLYRPAATLGQAGDPDGSTVGSELQLGALVNYADKPRRFALGPELLLSTVVTEKPFSRNYTSFELLFGGHYNIAGAFQIGAALGFGALRQPGTPDARALLRLAYAPLREPPKPPTDRDHDGVADRDDLCPDEPAGSDPDPQRPGCPFRDGDRDSDGVLNRQDLCPDIAKGPHPDPERPGCPQRDRDGDGVLDRDDICPDLPKGPQPDPARLGCPLSDRDSDGVSDREDVCPDQPQGPVPDPARRGCPAGDRDSDGVLDPLDRCPDQPQGPQPDPERPGCPAPDRDRDSVPDRVDACPDVAGAPHPDPKKNGCPSLVQISGGKLVILRPVFFATNRDLILPQSFPVLQAVTDALLASPHIKRVSIEGHTDNRGRADYNVDLSNRRAQSVRRWLLGHSIAEERVTAIGYGPNRPIADNNKPQGRAKNRRVDFVITDPAQPAPAPGAPAVPPPVVVDPASPAKPRPAKPVTPRKP
jgi:OOP family OmpA-OmpF porin